MSKRKTIMVAEDHVMVGDFVKTLLRDEGYDVLLAADGTEALELSRTHQGRIDLFLTDVEMPQMDGISAYRHIRTERADMKVLFMSGGIIQSELPEPWPFVSKPFTSDALLGKVHEILNPMSRRRPARAWASGIAGSHAIRKTLAVILVADHDDVRRETTENILTADGYRVLTASSAEEAEAVCDGVVKIALIVSDVLFPGESGVELAERQASRRGIGTLLISHVHRALLNKVPGFSRQPEFLANPFTPADLLKRVHELLKTAK